MILVDKPYVSNFLRETIENNKIKVVKTAVARELGFTENSNLIDEKSAVSYAKSSPNLKVYTS